MTNLENQTVSLELALDVLNQMELRSHLNAILLEAIRYANTTEERCRLEEQQAKQQNQVNELKEILIQFSTKPNTTYSVQGRRLDGSIEPYLIYNGWETVHKGVAENEAAGCNRQWGREIEFVVIENQK